MLGLGHWFKHEPFAMGLYERIRSGLGLWLGVGGSNWFKHGPFTMVLYELIRLGLGVGGGALVQAWAICNRSQTHTKPNPERIKS